MLVIFIKKTASRKIGALFRSIKFRSRKVALYLWKSTIRPHMEYYCRVLAGTPICFLELLNKVQKRICRIGGPSLVPFLNPWPRNHRRNVASSSLFCRYCLVDVHLNLLNWFHFLILDGGLLVILIDRMIFCHHS